MHLTAKHSQHRRDFTGTLTCAHCGHQEELRDGYDDAFYHEQVIPNMECPRCGKTGGGVATAPDVPAHVVI